MNGCPLDPVDGADSGVSSRDAGTPDAGGCRENCVVEHVVMVPMRDGVRLWTKVFLPADVPAGGLPTLLARTPYRFPGPADEHYHQAARFHVQRGYAFVQQDCRGRFESEGVFQPYEHEIEDGRDISEWIVKQSWSSGAIGTIGGSYNGFTALAAAIGNPHVKVVVADDPAQDALSSVLGGVPSIAVLSWLHLLDAQAYLDNARTVELSNRLELTRMDQEVLGRTAPLWQAYLAAPNPSDRYWETRSLSRRYPPLRSRLSGQADPTVDLSAVGPRAEPLRVPPEQAAEQSARASCLSPANPPRGVGPMSQSRRHES